MTRILRGDGVKTTAQSRLFIVIAAVRSRPMELTLSTIGARFRIFLSCTQGLWMEKTTRST